MNAMRWITLAAAIAGVSMMGIPAQGFVGIPTPLPPRGRPLPPRGWSYQWVPPVYQTVSDRHWIPERREMVPEWREVRRGQWEQVWREVVVPGRWEVTTRQVQVSSGYWQLVRLDPPPYLPPAPMPLPRPVVVSPGTVGVNGYQSGSGEDLSKFTPLREWPAK